MNIQLINSHDLHICLSTVLGYGRKGRKTFGGETRIEALIDQEEVGKKMGMSQDTINLGQLHYGKSLSMYDICIFYQDSTGHT